MSDLEDNRELKYLSNDEYNDSENEYSDFDLNDDDNYNDETVNIIFKSLKQYIDEKSLPIGEYFKYNKLKNFLNINK